MGNPNVLASQLAGVVGVIDPDAYAAATYTTGWIDMRDYHQLLAIIMVGVMASTSTVDAKLQQATDGSGTGAKDISGKAITQLTEAGTDDDKQALINLRQEELDVDNDFTHVRLSMTVAAAASDACAVVLGLNPRYGPADRDDLSSVAEIVT